MKYLAFDGNAVSEIISNRTLQSNDFEQAKLFCSALQNQSDYSNAFLHFHRTKSGIIVTGKETIDRQNCLIFDIEQANLLSHKEKDLLTIVQRCCRFSKKVWEGLAFSSSEKWMTNHTKQFGMVFPFQFCVKSPMKAIINICPEQHRQEKRNQRHHLCFAISSDHVKCDDVSSPAYNKFASDISEIQIVKEEVIEDNSQKLIQKIEFEKITESIYIDSLDFESWDLYLTKNQKEFINNPTLGPCKLIGPAGSGKTLSLILKTIALVKKNQDKKFLFVTHSQSMKNIVENAVKKIWPSFKNGDINNPPFLEVATLQEVCREKSSLDISETELLDTDALDSKITQTLYIEECISDFVEKEFETFKQHLSSTLQKIFTDFKEKSKQFKIADLFQTEFSAIIKGRANAKKETYVGLQRPKYGLPIDVNNENDFNAVYYVFRKYQERLEGLGVFDIDDIVISAISTLDAPIWSRRRQREGFDAIIIDETHLFNFNELAVFHKLLAKKEANFIIFAYDLVQSPNDLGVGKQYLLEAFKDFKPEEISLESVFRCSQEIVELAEFIIASGSTLFGEFPEKHSNALSAMTFAQEQKSREVVLKSCIGIENLCRQAFLESEAILSSNNCQRFNVLICATDDEIFENTKKIGEINNKPFITLNRRSDFESLNKAQERNLFVVGHIDQVGGTEFHYVIIIGADNERFPLKVNGNEETSHYHEYRSLNKLYVAVTRAMYGLIFLSDGSQGPSQIIKNAISKNLINSAASGKQ